MVRALPPLHPPKTLDQAVREAEITQAVSAFQGPPKDRLIHSHIQPPGDKKNSEHSPTLVHQPDPLLVANGSSHILLAGKVHWIDDEQSTAGCLASCLQSAYTNSYLHQGNKSLPPGRCCARLRQRGGWQKIAQFATSTIFNQSSDMFMG